MAVGDTIRNVSSIAGIVPGWGTAIAGLGTVAGGIADMFTAKKQREQAEKLRKETLATKPLGLQEEQRQKLEATKYAALAGLPTYELYKNALNEQSAQSMRNIRQTAPTGSAALEATSAVNIAQNAALNDLAAKDAMAKLELQKEVRGALGEVGALKDAQRLRTDRLQMAGMEQVSKLENAATYNRTLGLKNIAGALGKGGAALATFYSKEPATNIATTQQQAQPAAATTTTQQINTPAPTTNTTQQIVEPTTQMQQPVNNEIDATTKTLLKLTPSEQQEFDELYKMPTGEMTTEQVRRFNELYDKLESE